MYLSCAVWCFVDAIVEELLIFFIKSFTTRCYVYIRIENELQFEERYERYESILKARNSITYIQ